MMEKSILAEEKGPSRPEMKSDWKLKDDSWLSEGTNIGIGSQQRNKILNTWKAKHDQFKIWAHMTQ